MPKTGSPTRSWFRAFTALSGLGLMAYLVLRSGPQTIWSHVQAVGWGLVVIIALAGISHLLKTWAWRLTFTCDLSGISWSRSLAMRLISEAIAQIGIAGKVLGEGVRVSLLGSAVPIANGISSGALDAGLYILASALVTVSGVSFVLMFASVSAKWRLYALLFSGILLMLVVLLALAIHKGWRFISAITRAVGRIPGLKNRVGNKQAVVESAEDNLLRFHHDAPGRFWASLGLNFACHALAVLEVYIILHFMGVKVGLLAAFVLEGLTKLINTVGALNPGNVGTYEGGNVLITKLFGISASSGLTLALCRRARALFWAAIGAMCLIAMKRVTRQTKTSPEAQNALEDAVEVNLKGEPMTSEQNNFQTVIILANSQESSSGFSPELARVGTLPALLRTILTVQAHGASRIIVSVPENTAADMESSLRQNPRFPSTVEWIELGPNDSVSAILAEVAWTSETAIVLFGNHTYQPRLLQSAIDWNGEGALELVSNGQPAGAYVFSQSAAFALRSTRSLRSKSDLSSAMRSSGLAHLQEVDETSWHEISTPNDVKEAERKLNLWLVKPTDGLFARMNRRVSIPISRQLIKVPGITANMVTFFVLGVSIASGACFARGGYWYALVGAFLSVAASVLDGCDGEVARLKLQSTRFGCWLETVCDYLYYLFVFGGMTLGLTRSTGNRSYLAWGALLCFGSIMSFFVVSFARHRISGSQPEKFLATWQKKADARPSNPLLYLGRHCEFIIRRCFFPYALFFFAAVNLTSFVFVGTALGANIVWLIALYSIVTFSPARRALVPASSSAAVTEQAPA